jgi:uncharacterized membrane protein YedE/YeeE
MKSHLVSFAAGLLFAVGLALAGMGQPSTVVGFLDFAGHWNPSLMLLMCAGIPVVMIAHRVSVKLAKPVLAEHFPARPTTIDTPLLAGAAIFGAGWGLGGICPGPGLLSLAAGIKVGALMVAGMAAGMLLHGLYAGWSKARPADETGAADAAG